ncbi:MAG TPA: serine/threonine-protein kinase, partial [Vicinamibacteria bacterium]
MSTSESGSDLGARAQALIEVLGSRYRFVSMLGSGAFGEVYCVHDTMLERDVAVKRVRLDAYTDTAQRKELRERTIREAKVAAKLKHPHIVTIHDVVDRPDMSFIVMEFIEGKTLAKLLKDQRRLHLDETARILGQTAAALDFAHQKGVVHRDIKPANIMIENGSDSVKVMDFGIAKSDAFTELTAAGSVLGTPNYMSPEQARGDLAIGSRADLFSLGCLAYECVVGQKAFVGSTVMATLMTIMNDPPRPFDR